MKSVVLFALSSIPLLSLLLLATVSTEAFTTGVPRRFFASSPLVSVSTTTAAAAASTSTASKPAFVATTATALRAKDGDDEFFSFEPADDDLAALGDELGNDDDDDVVVTEAAPPVADGVAPVPGLAGAVVDFDDDAIVEEEDDDDDLDIPFDGDDDDDEVISEEVVAGNADDDDVAEEDFAYEEDEDDDYEYYEEEEQTDEWDELDAQGNQDFNYELQDDADPNYMIQKKRVEENMAKLEQEDEAMAKREGVWDQATQAMQADEETFEDFNFVTNFDAEAVARGEDEPQIQWSDDVAEKVKAMMESDDFMTINEGDIEQMSKSFEGDKPNLDDPFEAANAEIDEDLRQVEHDQSTIGADITDLQNLVDSKYDPDQKRSDFLDVNQVAEIGMSNTDAFDDIPTKLMDEIRDCLTEMGSASYNVTKWLVYDLDFNVTNLMLAACQHNPKAPVLFEHWLPQLQVCERYKYARDANFSFSWDDTAAADMEELNRYYRGFGYNEIPEKAPRDTGIINLEELDEDEVQMADFAAWCQEVYNPEWDRKDFDDDDIKDIDNVFSPEFVMPQHPDVPTYEDAQQDIRNWYGEIDAMNDGEVSAEQAEYRDMVGQELEYKYIDDKEFTDAFRGHLIVACTAEEEDLDVAEKITIRFEEEFGKQVFVETRVMSHALLEDNVFEVWLESYEIELLHSKKRATTGAKDWTGPIDCDDDEIEKLVERVAFLISDDARYSYRLDMGAILS